MLLANSDFDVVSLAGIFCVFGLPVLAWLTMRWFAHKERMEMIRNGMDPAAFKKGYRSWQAQPGPSAGTVHPGAAYPPPPPYAYPFPNEAAQIALRKAIVIVAVGFALTIGLSFIGFEGDHITPGPWLLGGLVPLFVGIAQVFSAMAAGATFRPYAPRNQQFGPVPPGPVPPGYTPPPTGDQSPSSGSYTYRPGAVPELRPPTPPTTRDN